MITINNDDHNNDYKIRHTVLDEYRTYQLKSLFLLLTEIQMQSNEIFIRIINLKIIRNRQHGAQFTLANHNVHRSRNIKKHYHKFF